MLKALMKFEEIISRYPELKYAQGFNITSDEIYFHVDKRLLLDLGKAGYLRPDLKWRGEFSGGIIYLDIKLCDIGEVEVFVRCVLDN